jgi:hypothetical protein
MELINKVKENLGHIKMSDDTNSFYISEVVFEMNEDSFVIEKLNNLVVLMNNELINGDIETFLDKDFETEIFNLI